MATTKGDNPLHSITPSQRKALAVLAAGGTHKDAADAAGVHRVTVSNWSSRHPGFRAETNRVRTELADVQRDRIRHIDDLALSAFQERIEAGDVSAINTWIKARGLAKIDTSGIGPTNSEQLLDEELTRRVADGEENIVRDFNDHIMKDHPLKADRELAQTQLESEILGASFGDPDQSP